MHPKKSLGQNFFVNENLGRKIVDYVASEKPDLVIEIGPGHGFFTRKLNAITRNLILIEKDDTLANDLQSEFPNAQVVNEDFLDIDLDRLEEFQNQRIVFFGSLPYNVSKPIIHKIIASDFFNNKCYFIIQKEVAEKYTAPDTDTNILSLKTQLYAQAKKLFDINPGSFIPQPKVTSSYIMFIPSRKTVSFNVHAFVKFLEICFRTPRKTLKNNLKTFDLNNIDPLILSKRPAELNLHQYIDIFTNLH